MGDMTPWRHVGGNRQIKGKTAQIPVLTASRCALSFAAEGKPGIEQGQPGSQITHNPQGHGLPGEIAWKPPGTSSNKETARRFRL